MTLILKRDPDMVRICHNTKSFYDKSFISYRQKETHTRERGYNPETPSNFRNNPKATPLDDTPTEAGIGGACHLVKLLKLHPMTDTRKQ